MKNQRPKNLNILTIRLPLPAFVSILHRLSGILLFLLIPVLLWGLDLSLKSAQDFDDLKQCLSHPCMKFLIWFGLSGLIYHFVAGIRHLLMDISLGDDLKSGRITAFLTILISGLLIILTGVWLW